MAYLSGPGWDSYRENRPTREPRRASPMRYFGLGLAAGNGEWRVEYQDDDGGCYMTIFAGPKAERRARDYFNALKTGALKTVRDGPLEH